MPSVVRTSWRRPATVKYFVLFHVYENITVVLNSPSLPVKIKKQIIIWKWYYQALSILVHLFLRMVPVEDGRPGGAATVQVIQGTASSHVTTTTRHIPSLHPRPTYDRPRPVPLTSRAFSQLHKVVLHYNPMDPVQSRTKHLVLLDSYTY